MLITHSVPLIYPYNSPPLVVVNANLLALCSSVGYDSAVSCLICMLTQLLTNNTNLVNNDQQQLLQSYIRLLPSNYITLLIQLVKSCWESQLHDIVYNLLTATESILPYLSDSSYATFFSSVSLLFETMEQYYYMRHHPSAGVLQYIRQLFRLGTRSAVHSNSTGDGNYYDKEDEEEEADIIG